MRAYGVSPLMGMVLAGVLALDGVAITAYAVGWDRIIAAAGPAGGAGRGRGGWRPPVLEADGAARVKPYEVFVQTAARPLFSRTRRPFAAPLEQAAAKAPEPVAAPVALAEPEAGLSAIAIRGDLQQALVITRAEPLGRWFRGGEVIEGWTVTGISADTLTLSAASRTKTIKLYDQPGVHGQPPAVAAPAPPAAALHPPQRQLAPASGR